jgi:hypothetical protein
MRNRFDADTIPKTQEQDQFRIGDSVRVHAIPTQSLKQNGRGPILKLTERAHPGDWPPGQDGSIAPMLERYRA